MFGGRHPSRGTLNHLLALGDDMFLEVMSLDPDQSSLPVPQRYFQLESSSKPFFAWCARPQGGIVEVLNRAREERIYDPPLVVQGSRVYPFLLWADGFFLLLLLLLVTAVAIQTAHGRDAVVAVQPAARGHRSDVQLDHPVLRAVQQPCAPSIPHRTEGALPCFIVSCFSCLCLPPQFSLTSRWACTGSEASHPQTTKINNILESLGVQMTVTKSEEVKMEMRVQTPSNGIVTITLPQ